jgi:superfamily II DNA helicase RecQ
MDTTRLTGTIVPAQVLLSGREVRDILSGVGEVRGWRNEQVTGLFKDRTGYWAAYMLSLIIERRITKRRLFRDSSLNAMATQFPRSLSDFRKICGVGESKLEKY